MSAWTYMSDLARAEHDTMMAELREELRAAAPRATRAPEPRAYHYPMTRPEGWGEEG